MTTVLALDPSIKSAGWALWSTGWPEARYGHWELAASVKGAARGCVRLQQLLIAMDEEVGGIDIIAAERAIPPHMIKGHTSYETILALAYVQGAILQFAVAKGCRSHLVNSGSWRATFIRDLKSYSNLDNKTLAQIRAREFGMSTAVHDEAEAIGLLDYQLHMEGITPPWRIETPLLKGVA